MIDGATGPPNAFEPPSPNVNPYERPSPYEPPSPRHPPPPPQNWQPASSKTNWRKILITLGSVFFVIVILVAACTVWFIGTVSAPIDRANEFLAAIDQGDYRGAVDLTSPRCNNGLTSAQLEDWFDGADISYNLSSVQITNSDATVSGSFTLGSESTSDIVVTLRKEVDWEVCGFNLS